MPVSVEGRERGSGVSMSLDCVEDATETEGELDRLGASSLSLEVEESDEGESTTTGASICDGGWWWWREKEQGRVGLYVTVTFYGNSSLSS